MVDLTASNLETVFFVFFLSQKRYMRKLHEKACLFWVLVIEVERHQPEKSTDRIQSVIFRHDS